MCAITNFTQTWAKLGNTTNYHELFCILFPWKICKEQIKETKKREIENP